MDMVAALARSLPYFLSWMVAGEAIGRGQLNPESETWLNELYSWWGIELPELDLTQFSGELSTEWKELAKEMGLNMDADFGTP
jgi:hypothetical protein